MDIGTKIKRLREHKNISQTVLAGQLGIAQNTLGLIEQFNHRIKEQTLLIVELKDIIQHQKEIIMLKNPN